MSKAVLISIQPKWCEKIARGEKTIEVRKNHPKLKPPFKCYIYCTASGITAAERDGNIFTDLRCKVIGEFTCDAVYAVLSHTSIFAGHPVFYKKAIEDACLTDKEIEDYSGGKDLCGWHISDLVTYDRPKELSEFYKAGTLSASDFVSQLYDGSGAPGRQSYASYLFTRAIRRPPQSWCYVEEVQG